MPRPWSIEVLAMLCIRSSSILRSLAAPDAKINLKRKPSVPSVIKTNKYQNRCIVFNPLTFQWASTIYFIIAAICMMIFCIAILLNDPYLLPWFSRQRGFFMSFLTFPFVQNRGIRSRPTRPQFPSLSVKERKAFCEPSFVDVCIMGNVRNPRVLWPFSWSDSYPGLLPD